MGVVVALMPLMSALLASLFAREALTASRLGGAGLSLLGEQLHGYHALGGLLALASVRWGQRP